MRTRTAVFMAAGAVILAGCQADREVFEEGATLAPPEEVEEAPAYPIPPQPIGTGQTADTALLDTLGTEDTLSRADTLNRP